MSNSDTKNILDEFFQNLKDFGDRLSMEDIDVAVESLQIAFEDLKLMKREVVQKKKEAERKQREAAEKQKTEEKIRKQKEHIKDVTCMDLPLDWSNPYNADERASGIYIESISDALVKSLTTLGRVDIEFIASVTGSDYKTVITALKGSIYQNPLTWNECFYLFLQNRTDDIKNSADSCKDTGSFHQNGTGSHQRCVCCMKGHICRHADPVFDCMRINQKISTKKNHRL